MRIGAVLLAASLLLGSGLLGSSAQAADDRLVIGQADKPALLNPLQVPAGGRETRAIKRQIFDALVVQNNELQPQPQLASSWTVAEETKRTFTLRDDGKFHNLHNTGAVVHTEFRDIPFLENLPGYFFHLRNGHRGIGFKFELPYFFTLRLISDGTCKNDGAPGSRIGNKHRTNRGSVR